jgi:MFS family permease
VVAVGDRSRLARGIYFLGYIVAVPVLVSLTDRIDARRIYLACAALSGVAMAGFGGFADDLWSACAGGGWPASASPEPTCRD